MKTSTKIEIFVAAAIVVGIAAFAVIDNRRTKSNEEAQEELFRGVQFYEQGDYDSAIACFDEAIRSEVDMSSAYLYRGDAYFNTGDFDKAIQDYTHVIRRESAQGAPWNKEQTMAQAYRKRGAAYEKRGDTERAQADFQQAKELDATAGE